ncbi:MarR family winged helix-turn-helix transcriptional regulator [Nonomuraea dietziae]|uniref:DNA-binding MarR family transcriptional regulator n=1 Tax=Nonomuraea dietziae TaxID=65515 RepID=A0A7W5V6G8_9ACTN|nr:MarR family transcriptional regulator [Nonomuraea dietziae]MBB3731491.1 DNA-binding MarR family transcriptional regulator [Nonomuraea dietziae]
MATLDDDMWVGVVRLHARVEHELAAALQRHGLGLSEYRALCHLSTARSGELRMQELADLLGLNQSSVTRLVGRLEAAGLTRRDLCANDRRGVYTVITEAGRERKDGASDLYEQTLTAALDRAASDGLTATVSALRESFAVG